MLGSITFLSLAMITFGIAIVRNCVFERTSTAGVGGVAAGTLASYGNRIWISMGFKNAAEGDPVNWRSDVVVEVTKTADTQVIADGADVQVNLTTQLVVASGGTVSGSARRGGSANGDATVFIALNQQA